MASVGPTPIKCHEATAMVFARCAIIAKDWENPTTRKLIHLYPEISEDGIIRKIWHAQKWRKNMNLDILSPMYDARATHYYVNEVSLLKTRNFVVPIRWVLFRGRVYADAFSIIFNDENEATIIDDKTILICANDLVQNYFDLQQAATTIETRQPARMPNPKRLIAQGDPLYLSFVDFMSFVDYFGDDVSGNHTKSWNKHWNAYMTHRNLPRKLLQQEFHVHFISTSPNAGISEQFREFKASLFKRTKSRPPRIPRTAAEQQLFNVDLNQAAQYLSGTGPFASWFENESPHRASYRELHGENPIVFWEMLQSNVEVDKLAKFALMLLHLVVNQAGLEPWFSDFSNKKNKKRNRLGLQKMVQQAKVTHQICDEQQAEGLLEERGGRKNHSELQIQTLLSVPRYANAILSDTDDSRDEGGKISVMVWTSSGWRKQVAKWQAEMRELDAVSDDDGAAGVDDEDDDLPASVPIPPRNGSRRTPRSWLPTTLVSLFAGVVSNPITLTCRDRVVSEESLYMELLAAEHSDEEPDAGAQEGFGDDYDADTLINTLIYNTEFKSKIKQATLHVSASMLMLDLQITPCRAKSQPILVEKAGLPRTKEQILDELEKQVKLACFGVPKHVKDLQTQTGIKDMYMQYWIDQLLLRFKEHKIMEPDCSDRDIQEELVQWTLDNRDKIYSAFLTMKGFDPTKDTPVEILHTILLGIVKYIWHISHTAWTPEQKWTYSFRLQSTATDGLSIHVIRANYIMQYAGSLIGRQFKTLAQTNVFYVYGLVTEHQFMAWKATGELEALLWFPEIWNLAEYRQDLQVAVANVLDVSQ
ncbi:hypothetical protein B0H10DRAFT_1953083 [Mycena sp. CBHHK59/15]|nr:hypothetical protein B0H10DRAFT_1953083 [Mycena sp. CBHHK59/15]